MRIVLTCLVIFIVSKVHGQDVRNILAKSISELDKIESFEYLEISKATAAFDTTDFVSEYLSKIIGVRNLQDSIIGYNYISYWRDTSQVYKIYNFDYEVEFNWYDKSAQITDFRKHLELRQSNYAPFYTEAKTMLDFALNGNQADIILKKNSEDTLVLEIQFNRNRYEFMGKIVSKQSRDGYAWSKYTVWIDKKSYLPFKVYKKHEYQKTINEIIYFKINFNPSIQINALESIPDNFSIHEYGKRRKPANLSGTIAPTFKLLSATNDSISLSDLHGKVILLEFTSIGCGPCHLAIPELNQLYQEFDKARFEILSIEAYLFNKKDVFARYIDKNDIEYSFLIGNEEVTDNYKVAGVPYFIIIDQNGIIQEYMIGFSKNKTVPKLKAIVESLIE